MQGTSISLHAAVSLLHFKENTRGTVRAGPWGLGSLIGPGVILDKNNDRMALSLTTVAIEPHLGKAQTWLF